MTFDKGYWENQLKHSDWYVRLKKELEEVVLPVAGRNHDVSNYCNDVYEVIKEMLEKNQIPLANTGPNLDIDRKLPDTIVVHHTETKADIKPNKLSAIGFVRQYAKRYLQNDILGHRLVGQPIWSGHFRGGRMVFFAYHWLVKPDGEAERLLEDKYLGFHSGSDKINNESIAIAFSGDLANKTPSEKQITQAAKIIKEHYPYIDKNKIFGHLEVNPKKNCPGKPFLKAWKNTLITLAS